MDDRDSAHPSSSAKDGDGVRIVERGGRGGRPALLYKALALVLVGCSAAYLLIRNEASLDAGNTQADARAVDAHDNDAAGPASPSTAIASRRDMTPQPDGSGQDPTPDLADALSGMIKPGEEPPMAQVIDELHKAGIHTGIGAFPPPGTSPPLIGLAVPDDYVLPEGYVRHFQATDDGQRIEPILMYSPDFEFYDASGKPIRIPENMVVPAGMAPPGLTIRRIVIPPAQQPGKP
jgi:hypothetical protein